MTAQCRSFSYRVSTAQFAVALATAFVLLAGISSASAATRTWAASPGSALWSVGANWGGTAPVAGDTVAFGTSSTTTLNNDITAGTSFAAINFNAGASAFTLTGNNIVLGGTVTNSSTNTQNINFDMSVAANRTFVTTAGGGDLVLGGVVSSSGTFGVTKDGNGTLTLTNTNTYTGPTALTLGSVTFGSASLASRVQTLGTLTVAAGNDANVTSVFGNSGSASLTFGAQTYTAGGIANFVVSGGVNGSTNQIKLTASAGFLNKQTFFNGGDYAYMDTTNGYVRAPSYTGSDAGFVTAGSSLTAASHNLITSSITGQGSIAVNTLKFSGNSAVDLTQDGGTITFNGSSGILRTGGGSTTISGGTITTGDGLSYVVRADTSSDSLTINSDITKGPTVNANSFTKSGAGTVTLGGQNTYTGTTFVDGGTLNITGNQNGLGGTTVYAATLNLNNASAIKGGTITTNNPLSSVTENTANAINATTGVSLAITGGSVNLSQTNNFGSGTITLNNAAATLTLAGANTITGATTLSAGTIILGDKGSLGTSAITSTAPNIQASTALTGANKIANNFTGTGTTVFNGSNSIEIGGNWTNSSASRTITNSITGGNSLTLDSLYLSEAQATGRVVTLNGTGTSTTINAIADSAAGVSSSGASGLILNSATQTFTLPNANTYSGATTLSAGTLSLGNKAAFGTSAVAFNGVSISASTDLSGLNKIANSGTIGGTTVFTGSNNIELGGTFTDTDNRTITSNLSAGTLTLSGTVGLSSNANSKTLTLNGTGIGVISGTIQNNGTGGTATGGTVAVSAGNWTFSGSGSTYTTTSANGGILGIGSSTGLGTSNLVLGNGTVMAVGGPQTISNTFSQGNANSTFGGTNALTLNGTFTNGGSGTLTINNTALTTFGGTFYVRDPATAGNAQRSMTFNGTGDLTISGNVLNGSTANGILAFNGTGTSTLSGNNNYSGATTVGTAGSASTLKIGSSTALGFGGVSTVAGNTTVNPGATLDLNGQIGIQEPIAINGVGVGGNGALINSNTGTAAVIEDGFASIGVPVGGTGYTDGSYSLDFTGGGGTGAAATATIVGGIVTSVQVTNTGSGYTGNPTATLPVGAGTPLTPATITTSSSSLSLNSTSNVGGAGDINIKSAILGGAVGLTKIGAGKVTLTGAAAYTGATIINAGTVQLGAADRLANASTMTLAGGTFNTGGFNETVGALTLSSSSVIDLADGASILHYADSSAIGWTGTLSVWNWTGTMFTGGGADQLIFGNSAGGLAGAQVAQVNFYSGAGTGFIGGGMMLSTGELVAIPEPPQYAVGVMAVLGGLIFLRNRRRRLGA